MTKSIILENNKEENVFDSDEESLDSQDLYEHFRFVADKNQSLLRIDKFLIDRMMNISRSRIQQAAEANCIIVNGKPVKSNYRIKPNDVVAIMMNRPRLEIEIIPENIPLNIIYEDNDLIIVNKPAGIVVHPGHGNYTGTLVNALAYHLKDNSGYDPSDPNVGLVHRIDKDTSGLLVVAKNAETKTHLSLQFYNRTIQRKYIGIVWGILKEDTGTIEGHIGRDLHDRMLMAVFPEGDHGKHAITHFQVINRIGYVSILECKLETGRTHQIRVHLKHIGYPIFNDSRYGGDQILKGQHFSKYKQFVHNCFMTCPRQALHAKSLGFIHPSTGKEMFFESDLPEDMKNLAAKWENYVINNVS